mgnify:CR=1 FL=1
MKKKSEHYVNNKEFLAAMVEYRKSVNRAKRKKEPKPPVTDYIGSCFLKIANHLSYRPNFINYTYRDDMISDGIENCLQYLDNFNPKKSNNPFAYFTQIIYYAFIRRIQREKKQQHVKHKIIENMNIDILADGTDMDQNAYVDYLQKNFLPDEDVYKPKKKKEQLKGLEKFYNEDSEINENSANN